MMHLALGANTQLVSTGITCQYGKLQLKDYKRPGELKTVAGKGVKGHYADLKEKG